MLVNSILEAVGNTPLIRLGKMSSGNVFAKADFLNPGGSVKDRVAKNIIESAEKEGKLTRTQLEEIAKEKMADLNANDVEAAMKIVAGTARSMGIDVE